MSQPREIVERVVDDCISTLAKVPGIDKSTATAIAGTMAQKAKQRALQGTADIFRERDGDAILTRCRTDPDMLRWVEERRAEGVTDWDIRWWWNICAFEREMLLQADEFNRQTLYSFLRDEKGLDDSKAVLEVNRRHPFFGERNGDLSDDASLPFELKRRIVTFIENHRQNPRLLESKVTTATSFNALVRQSIRDDLL